MKRFYKVGSVAEDERGFHVELDGRELKSPAKRPLVVPKAGLAEAIAAEWEAQGDEIAPGTMPMMQLASTAIDRVTTQRDAVVSEIAGFGGSDLLCYRAEEPDELIALQQDKWQPLLDWAADYLGAPLEVASGIMPLRQSEIVLETLKGEVGKHSDLQLSALHALTAASGSLVIALAVSAGRISAEEAFQISQVDETFQIEKWGEDHEAQKRREMLHRDIVTAGRFLDLC